MFIKRLALAFARSQLEECSILCSRTNNSNPSHNTSSNSMHSQRRAHEDWGAVLDTIQMLTTTALTVSTQIFTRLFIICLYFFISPIAILVTTAAVDLPIPLVLPKSLPQLIFIKLIILLKIRCVVQWQHVLQVY
jgi:hypothetical protein